jgi:hypothetical protein
LWLLASLPGVVVILAAVLGVLDGSLLSTRTSIVLSGLTISLGAFAVLAAMSRPWRVSSRLGRIVAVASTGLAIAGFLLVGSMAIGSIQEEVIDSSLRGVRGVVATESGLLALGNDGSGNVVVWLSENGDSWARAEHSDVLAGVDVGDVVVFDRQVLVAGQDSESGMGVVLSSTDGVDWRRDTTVARNLKAPEGIEMTRLLEDLATTAAWVPQGIADADNGLVMVGGTYGNAPVFWHSPDAVAWSVADPLPIFDTGNKVIDVVAWRSGFVALGIDSDGEPEVWTSHNGERWILHEPELDAHPTLVAATTDIAILIEQTNSGAQVWSSVDAETWTPHDAEALAGSRIDVVTPTSSGFAAVGVNSAGGRVMWHSSDGLTWDAVASEEPSDTVVHDLVSLDSSVVVVGYDRETNMAAFWTVDKQRGWIRVNVDSAMASLG